MSVKLLGAKDEILPLDLGVGLAILRSRVAWLCQVDTSVLLPWAHGHASPRPWQWW